MYNVHSPRNPRNLLECDDEQDELLHYHQLPESRQNATDKVAPERPISVEGASHRTVRIHHPNPNNDQASYSPRRNRSLPITRVIPGQEVKPIRTQARAATILPSFVGLKFQVYNGKEYGDVEITEEMVGHKLGEFVTTRKPFIWSRR
ncbi:hypothetical protein F4804DRAFT_329968 [Jackrogersella minutella]|nr:hypothetical protein F4804DRAFT_329968 [Jackrogersella minutella]